MLNSEDFPTMQQIQQIKKILVITLLVLKIIAYTIIGLLVTYAVIFSIVGSMVIYKGYRYFTAPIKEVALYKTFNPKQTKFMEKCLSDLAADSLSPDTLIHAFIPLDSISPNLTEAVIAAEDDGFYLHPRLVAVFVKKRYSIQSGIDLLGSFL